jgi:hypothetical protein
MAHQQSYFRPPDLPVLLSAYSKESLARWVQRAEENVRAALAWAMQWVPEPQTPHNIYATHYADATAALGREGA